MKGKVFIGWTKSEDLAICVKEELKKYNFNGICGGRQGENEILAGIGATVINQMNKCSSAIMLFTKRDENIVDDEGRCICTEILSPNMLYELGYLSGSLNLKRVMSVYIDGAENLVPTDIKGGWQETLNTNGMSNKEIAKIIVKKFIDGQCNLITGNKMDLMTDISRLRSIIREHMAKPVYYDDEIAYIILLLCQASYMHDEKHTDKLLIEELYNTNITNKKCLLAINSTIDYFDACAALVDDMRIPDRTYKRLRRNLLQYVDEAKELEEDQFKHMFLMICYDYLTFINMMHYAGTNPDDIDEDILKDRELMALNSIEHANIFCNYNEIDNLQFAQLYLSYTYRNLAKFYKSIGKNDEAQEQFEKSIQVRKSLHKHFQLKNLNKTIGEQIKMEYFLSLSDNLPDVAEDVKKKRIRELEDYMDEVNEGSFNRKYLNGEIARVLDEVTRKN